MNKLKLNRFVNHTRPERKRFLDDLFSDLGIDVLAVSGPEHFPFMSDANLPNLTYVRSRQAYAVFTSSGEQFLIVCAMDAPMVASQTWIETVVPYTEFVQHPVAVLADELRKRGLAAARVGMDLDFVTHRTARQLKEQLPDVQLVDTYDGLALKRVIKTPAEIETISSAARMTHLAILDGMGESRHGETEREVCSRVLSKVLNYGARTILFSSFGSGANALHTHCFAGDKVIEPTDIVRLDIGPRFGPWLGDLARTYSAGDPSAAQRSFYRALILLQRETIDVMKPGITAASVYRHCVETAVKLGITFEYPHVGHSIGLELHESPMLHPGDHTVLQEGMVFNVEPMIVNHDHTLFMHTEDLVVIQADCPRILTLGLAPEEIPVIGNLTATH